MTKVVVCFFTGICYFVAGIGVVLSKITFVRLCVFGSLLFLVLYIVELILWGSTHTRVWIDFSIFGGLSVFFGLFSYKYGKAKREKHN
jgi:intracellular septation protein A